MTSESPGALSGPSGSVRPLVLIVDDNEKNAKLARDVLRGAGYATLEAATGAEGLRLAVEHLPDVILMDLRLPDIDGIGAARKLSDEPRTAGIPVVALSALPGAGIDAWVLAGGFAGYIEKPISVADFPDQVRRYVTRRRE